MKSILLIFVWAAALVAMAGCWSPEAKARREQARVMVEQERVKRIEAARIRIEQQPALFARLTGQEQAVIREGEIRVGFTPDMVRLALGEPDQAATYTAPFLETVWSYDVVVVPYTVAAPSPTDSHDIFKDIIYDRHENGNTRYTNMHAAVQDPSMRRSEQVAFREGRVWSINAD